MLTYAMASTYGNMNLISTLTVKWPTLMSCKSGASCLVQLLDAQQMVVSCFTLATVMLLCVTFPPGNNVRLRLIAAATLLLNVSLLGVGWVISATAPCSRLSLDFASGLSLVSGVVVSVAFAPQVVATYRAKGRGSISYIYFTIQAAGCGLVVGFQLFALHDPWPVWGPTLVSGTMQGTILATGLYYRCCTSEVPEEVIATTAPAEPLLEQRE